MPTATRWRIGVDQPIHGFVKIDFIGVAQIEPLHELLDLIFHRGIADFVFTDEAARLDDDAGMRCCRRRREEWGLLDGEHSERAAGAVL